MIFNLFKKKEEVVSVLENPKNYPQEVLEIHNEFNSAADKLLKEANLILSGSDKINKDKIERLKKLGFTGSEEIIVNTPLIKQLEMSEEQIAIVSYYKKKYPKYKFIREDQLIEICKKYNLISGNISRYKGFVPNTNLVEIEKFKVEACDIEDLILRRRGYDEKRYILTYLQTSELTKNGLQYINQNLLTRERLTEKASEYFTKSFILRTKKMRVENEYYEIITNPNKGLQIVAPVSKMNTSGMSIENSLGLERVKANEVPDPVVYQPVKHGFLICSMWADETHDPTNDPILNN